MILLTILVALGIIGVMVGFVALVAWLTEDHEDAVFRAFFVLAGAGVLLAVGAIAHIIVDGLTR